MSRRNVLPRGNSPRSERAMKSTTTAHSCWPKSLPSWWRYEGNEDRNGRGATLGLRDDESLSTMRSVRTIQQMELGDDVSAHCSGVVDVVRANATVDWDKKEQVRASLRRHIRRLHEVPLPPDSRKQLSNLSCSKQTPGCWSRS